MRILLFTIISLFLLANCSKTKTVLICGDHVCVNKSEAEQFFEENLSIEVKVINKKIKKEIDLIELNLKKDPKGSRKVSYASKVSLNKNLKTLSKNEITEIKKKINNKKKKEKIVKKVLKEKNKNKKKNIYKNVLNPDVKKISNKNVNKKNNNYIDVCTILEKCSIDEISKYLLKQGKAKDFPDITTRQ